MTGLLGLTACGGGGTVVVLEHTVQLSAPSGPPVRDVRNAHGDLTAIAVGDNRVLLTDRLYGVRGGGDRAAVGSVLRNGELLVRHVDSHWNRQTNLVTKFEHISYGAWATVSGPEGIDFAYESLGDAYLIALDNARTSPAAMPVSGAATWLGQGTGFIRGHGGDVFGLIMADVTMTADFANAELTADLSFTGGNRVVIHNTIQGNVFSGTEFDMVRATDTGNAAIQTEGATARFSGGFYGAGAVEVGGVFEVIGGRTGSGTHGRNVRRPKNRVTLDKPGRHERLGTSTHQNCRRISPQPWMMMSAVKPPLPASSHP